MRTTLGKPFGIRRSFLWYAATIVGASLLTTQTMAGSLTVIGSQSVSSNLSPQSITLGGTTLSNWPTGFRPGVVLTNGVLDTSLSQFYAITLTNNITWSFQGHSAGRIFWLKILQGSTGGWTNSWDANVMWVSGLSPVTSLASNVWDLFQFVDDGSKWSGTASGIGYATNLPNYALLFDGVQNYAQSSSAFSETVSNFTMECWFIGNGVSGENPSIITTTGDDESGTQLGDILVYSDHIAFEMETNRLSGSASLLNGAWHTWPVSGTEVKEDCTSMDRFLHRMLKYSAHSHGQNRCGWRTATQMAAVTSTVPLMRFESHQARVTVGARTRQRPRLQLTPIQFSTGSAMKVAAAL